MLINLDERLKQTITIKIEESVHHTHTQKGKKKRKRNERKMSFQTHRYKFRKPAELITHLIVRVVTFIGSAMLTQKNRQNIKGKQRMLRKVYLQYKRGR